jgi:hypothetical protein
MGRDIQIQGNTGRYWASPDIGGYGAVFPLRHEKRADIGRPPHPLLIFVNEYGCYIHPPNPNFTSIMKP